MKAGRDRVGPGYTDEAYAIFPRYRLLQAVLDQIEALDPDALPEIGQLRKLLVDAAHTASPGLAEPLENRICQQVIASERRALADLFGRVAVSELDGIARVIELREYGASYELDSTDAVLGYTGAEGFWTAAGAEWIVYCSHEGTMTLGGRIATWIAPEFPAAHVNPSNAPCQQDGRC